MSTDHPIPSGEMPSVAPGMPALSEGSPAPIQGLVEGGQSGRYSYEGLERLIHEKARLGILSSLAAHPVGLVFADLKDLCALTDGNLSRHLSMLADAGLVEICKSHHNNRSHTRVRLTDYGRLRFWEYINVLESVVADAQAATASRSPAPQTKHPQVETDNPRISRSSDRSEKLLRDGVSPSHLAAT